ncbi:MAG: hypothetical protein COB59_11185 [Rhodospirillaceae bacterium]|nr:MAG: hypothetical protein COB59_11185 [Rhodospirillaceae bacterium]
MKDRNVLKTGLIGTGVAAVCCFTPALVIVLGVAGLSASLAWLDWVLLPGMAIFMGIAGYGLYLLKKPHTCDTEPKHE